MNYLKLVSLLLFLLVASTESLAEVYRWVDEDGKVRYSDKPPAGQQADDITEQVGNINVDTSQQEQAKMGKVFARETTAERRAREQQENQQQQERAKLDNACAEAQEELRVATEERFVFTDEDGNPMKSSKQQEQQYRERLEKIIQQNCQ